MGGGRSFEPNVQEELACQLGGAVVEMLLNFV